MHVLRVFMRSGVQIELLYRGIGDIRRAVHALEAEGPRIKLADDFGKGLDIRSEAIDGWQPSDYAAELEGALAIAQAKQEAQEKFGREMQKRHSLLVPTVPGLPNGRQIIQG